MVNSSTLPQDPSDAGNSVDVGHSVQGRTTLFQCVDCNGTGDVETGIGMLMCGTCHGSGNSLDVEVRRLQTLIDVQRMTIEHLRKLTEIQSLTIENLKATIAAGKSVDVGQSHLPLPTNPPVPL